MTTTKQACENSEWNGNIVNSATGMTAAGLWRRAKRDRPTAQLLGEALLDTTLGRILTLHREELFPLLEAAAAPNLSFSFGTSAFVLLSHPSKMIAYSMRVLDRKRRVHSYVAPRQERTSELVRELDEVTRQTLIDKVVIEALKVVQGNAGLRALVNQGYPISREELKRTVGDYSALDLKPLESATFQLFQRIIGGKRSKKALHQIAVEVDALTDFLDLERFQLLLFSTNLAHYRQLIRGLRISEDLWKDSIHFLHAKGFLEHVGPLYLWCTRCPESGVLASVRTTHLLRPLRCPRCGRSAYSSTTLFPANGLDVAIRLPDGMLGAAIGWQLTSRRIRFQHSLKVAGTELDFLVSKGQIHALIECKMNHQLKEHPQLLTTLKENFAQLNAHVLAAQGAGIALHTAVCVVNHPRAQLGPLQRIVGAPQKSTVPMQLLSYQDFIPWLKRLPSSRGRGTAFISG